MNRSQIYFYKIHFLYTTCDLFPRLLAVYFEGIVVFILQISGQIVSPTNNSEKGGKKLPGLPLPSCFCYVTGIFPASWTLWSGVTGCRPLVFLGLLGYETRHVIGSMTNIKHHETVMGYNMIINIPVEQRVLCLFYCCLEIWPS